MLSSSFSRAFICMCTHKQIHTQEYKQTKKGGIYEVIGSQTLFMTDSKVLRGFINAHLVCLSAFFHVINTFACFQRVQ